MPIRYTVKAGDNLWSIAKETTGDPMNHEKIALDNGIENPSLIRPGQVLMIEQADGPPLPQPKPDLGSGPAGETMLAESQPATMPLPRPKPPAEMPLPQPKPSMGGPGGVDPIAQALAGGGPSGEPGEGMPDIRAALAGQMNWTPPIGQSFRPGQVQEWEGSDIPGVISSGARRPPSPPPVGATPEMLAEAPGPQQYAPPPPPPVNQPAPMQMADTMPAPQPQPAPAAPSPVPLPKADGSAVQQDEVQQAVEGVLAEVEATGRPNKALSDLLKSLVENGYPIDTIQNWIGRYRDAVTRGQPAF